MRQALERQRTERQGTERQGEELDLIDISRAGKGRQKASRSGYRSRTAEEVRIRRKRRNGLQTKLNIDASSVSRSFFIVPLLSQT